MTKEKLMDLYHLFSQLGVDTKKISDLKHLSDKEIDIIINSKYQRIIVELLLNDVFKLYNHNLQMIIIKELSKYNKENVYRIVDLITNPVMVNRNNVLDFVRLMGVVEKYDTIDNIAKIAKSEVAYESGKSLELAKFLLTLDKDYKVRYVTSLFTNKVALNSDKLYDFLPIMVNTTVFAQAEAISMIACDEALNRHSDIVDIVWLISKETSHQKIIFLTEAVRNKFLKENDNLLYIVSIIKDYKFNYQMDMARYIINNIKVLGTLRVLSYLEKLKNVVNESEIADIYAELREDINDIISKNGQNFWALFNKDEELAMKLLDENLANDEEVDDYTLVLNKDK